jgi:hypothetical protein
VKQRLVKRVFTRGIDPASNKKAAPNIGAAFRFYPHHFKTDDRVVT